MSSWIKRAAFLLAVLGAWQLACSLRVWPEYLFPSPASVFETFCRGFTEGQFTAGILASLRRLLIGYAISAAAGLLLGFGLAWSRNLDEVLGGFLLGLQTLPSVCWLPLALLWFGLNDRAIIFVVVVGSVVSITLSVRSAVRLVPPLLVNAGRTLGASGGQLLWRVVLPAALPSVAEGLKQGWSFAWRSLMAGELLFVTVGLGHLLNLGRELNDMSQVIAVMALIVMIGVAVDRTVFAWIDRKLDAVWGFRKL